MGPSPNPATLGARGFSCAVSGFGQVLKSDPRENFFLATSPLVSSAFGRRRVGLRPTKVLVTREKKPLVPRVKPSRHFDIRNPSMQYNMKCRLVWVEPPLQKVIERVGFFLARKEREKQQRQRRGAGSLL